MPVYKLNVTIGETKQVRLVEAPNEAQALRHAMNLHITAEVVRSAAQIREMAELAANGVKVESVEQ